MADGGKQKKKYKWRISCKVLKRLFEGRPGGRPHTLSVYDVGVHLTVAATKNKYQATAGSHVI
jgi:hypothetical protein